MMPAMVNASPPLEQDSIAQSLRDAAAISRGHFRYESGHHGDLWLDLDSLFVDARSMRDWTASLAQRAASCRPEIVCGPLTRGAFVAQHLAAELGAAFVYAERLPAADGTVRYRIPPSLRTTLPAAACSWPTTRSTPARPCCRHHRTCAPVAPSPPASPAC
jgi:hypothetical protein